MSNPAGRPLLNVLVTGSNGFVGKNLCVALKQLGGLRLREYDVDQSPEELHRYLDEAELIFHLAGVNRPRDLSEYDTGNAGFTAEICAYLSSRNRAPKIVFSSSIQAELDNPYGISKRKAEEFLRRFAETSRAACVVYRLKNLFGKWCRPNYNAVTATFCHNIAKGLPITISDRASEIELTYIDDVIKAFCDELVPGEAGFRFGKPLPCYHISLGKLADTIQSFHSMRVTLALADFSDSFVRALYATYLSYLPPADLGYRLETKSDPRGSLAEFVKSKSAGQVFVSRTRPGIIRGNHYHHTKVEKFLVVQGEAVIRLRLILGGDVIEYKVRGEDFQVVDIPPGYTHSIQNTGSDELVTIFWADEVFDPGRPDTHQEQV